jgi:hypothetical protein
MYFVKAGAVGSDIAGGIDSVDTDGEIETAEQWRLIGMFCVRRLEGTEVRTGS